MRTVPTVLMLQTNTTGSEIKSWSKALLISVLIFAAAFCLMTPAFAGPTGGATGTATASSTRIMGVVTGWQLIIFSIGAFILSAAFMYVGYAMAFGGKRWSDIANVVYGAVIAGMGPMLVGWFFS